MTESSVFVLNLHENQKYLQDCANLLNKQWERSSSARVQSLEKASKDLPDSIILIEEIGNVRNVIGHSRLTRVLEDNNGCWIGSVVISEEKRKKGYGKYLMKKSEEYAKNLNFTTVYLNTQDQQTFYEHLGYQYCDAVSSIGFKPNRLLLKGMHNSTTNHQSLTHQSCQNNHYPNAVDCNKTNDYCGPPPPPPLPTIKTTQIKTNLGQYWMKKSLL